LQVSRRILYRKLRNKKADQQAIGFFLLQGVTQTLMVMFNLAWLF